MSPPTEKMIYFTMGLPGSGKTHFCEKFARGNPSYKFIDVAQLSSDVCLEPNFPPGGPAYIYGALAGCALMYAREGRGVLLDGNYNTIERRQGPIQVAQVAGARCMALWLKVPDDIVMERITRRRQSPQRRRESPQAIFERMQASFEPPTEIEMKMGLTVAHIDGTTHFGAQYEQLLRFKKS